ncbi:MAG: carbohydrate binding family 9 domain-containing protein, partial [Gemmatimonadetes bacterium]|nr:carbohydrate binding family 9 domain-containing protein [Gemmatimonadota bacterium]
MPLSRLTGEVVLDGRVEEAAWEAVEPLPMTMFLPVFQGTPTQRTEIRVAYDDENLYFAGRFFDNERSGIRINSLYRDRWNGDDAFAIYIDAFNDNRNAKWFGVTPAGMRFDVLLSDDGQTFNNSWDGFWDAHTTVTPEGWFTEVRIPFSTLGFRALDGQAVFGLTVTRLVARLNERVTFPAIEPRYEFRQPSVAQDVAVTGVRAATPLYLTPYVLSGLQQTPLHGDGMNEFSTDREHPREIGLDARYAVSNQLTLDVTANTDFAQVEADDQQVNLDRFSLFFPEKRRFFQERSELFDFVMGSTGGRLFHSRRIGIGPDNTAVPVLGGARLVGSVGRTELALLDMHTERRGLAPAENFGVARVRRPVFNAYSNVGAMLTTRAGGGEHNVAYGVDGNVRMFGDDHVQLRWAQTVDDDGVSALDRAQWYVNWHRRTTRGLMYQASHTRSGPGYRPGMGFLPRRDFWTANAMAEYYFFTDSHPWLRRIWPGALAFSTFHSADGVLESGQYAVWLQWETKSGGGGWIEPKLFREDVATGFAIAGAEIPPGRYTFADLQLVLNMGSGRRLRAGIDARAGTYFDGTRQQFILTPTWNVGPRLELGGEWQHTRLRFPDRAQKADIDLARLRVRAALDARASANAF